MELTKLENLSKENIIFHPAKGYSVKNKKGAIVIETPFLFSY